MVPARFRSPPATTSFNESLVVISSSPEFPYIGDILAEQPKRKETLRSGKNAAPIPADAVKTFTSAARIFRSELVGAGGSAKQPVLTRDKVEVEDAYDETLSDTLPPRLENADKTHRQAMGERKEIQQYTVDDKEAEDSITEALVVPPAKKPPKKKSSERKTADGQTTLPKSRVTKPAAQAKTAPRKKNEATSKYFAETNEIEPPAEVNWPNPKGPLDLNLGLEPAMRRKTDWTPPRETTQIYVVSSSPAVNEPLSTTEDPSEPAEMRPKDVFKNLAENYGFKLQDPPPKEAIALENTGDVLGKRKLIEMIVLNSRKTPEPSPTKVKAPKKKPRTITELATAAYRVSENSSVDSRVPDDMPPPGSLKNYFAVDDGTDTSGPRNASKAVKAPAKRKTRAKPAAKKAEPRKQVLLSPSSALRQVSRQDFVFGTSSQLATEEDPALLRALHEAMVASNKEDGPFSDAREAPSRASTKLWTAAARDVSGDLLDLEVIDLVDSPAIPRDYALPAHSFLEKESMSADDIFRKAGIVFEPSDPGIDLADSPQLPQPKPQKSSETQRTSAFDLPTATTNPLEDSAVLHTKSRLEPPPNEPEPFSELPPSNQEQNEQITASQAKALVSKDPSTARPKYELFTDAQLARAISGYGFKPIKRRAAMIALLDECWASKSKAVSGIQGQLSSLSTSSAAQAPAPTSATSAPAPSKPRELPRKSTSATAADTTSAPVTKRPRGRPRKDSASNPAKSAPKASKTKAAASLSASQPTSVVAVVPPSSQTRRPATPKRRKPAAAATTQPVIEIADSDAEDSLASSPLPSPSPARSPLSGANKKSNKADDDVISLSPSPSLSPTPFVDGDADADADPDANADTSLLADTSPSTQQAALFDYIARAVTSAPRTRDPQFPSWHEKMLMYDPIVLEDLTAWLNAGQLGRVGYDGEVAPGVVKKWCESRSVCCLWRVNLHGRERKRF